MRVVSPFHNSGSRRDPGLSTGKTFGFPTPTAPAGVGLKHRDGSRQEHRALCTSPLWCFLGITGMRVPASPTQLCREALDKVNLAGFRGSLLVWMGLKCPELTHTHLHPSDLGFSWLSGAHSGSFSKHQSRGTAMR